MQLYRVTLPYACYGLMVYGDRISDAPPIAKWMVGRTWPDIQKWITQKGGRWELVS